MGGRKTNSPELFYHFGEMAVGFGFKAMEYCYCAHSYGEEETQVYGSEISIYNIDLSACPKGYIQS